MRAAAIARRLKVDVPVIVKSAGELAIIISQNPIDAGAEQHSRALVAFTQDSKSLPGLTSIRSLVTPPERFEIGKNAAYLLCPEGVLQSKAWVALQGKPGAATTTRNWATVLKLQALASKGDS